MGSFAFAFPIQAGKLQAVKRLAREVHRDRGQVEHERADQPVAISCVVKGQLCACRRCHAPMSADHAAVVIHLPQALRRE